MKTGSRKKWKQEVNKKKKRQKDEERILQECKKKEIGLRLSVERIWTVARGGGGLKSGGLEWMSTVCLYNNFDV